MVAAMISTLSLLQTMVFELGRVVLCAQEMQYKITELSSIALVCSVLMLSEDPRCG